jgi:hypothetical protein
MPDLTIKLTDNQREEVWYRLDNYAAGADLPEPFGRLEGNILTILDLGDAIDEAEDIAHIARDHVHDGGFSEMGAVTSADALVRKLKALKLAP